MGDEKEQAPAEKIVGVERITEVRVRGVAEYYGGKERFSIKLKGKDTLGLDISVDLIMQGVPPVVNQSYTLALLPSGMDVVQVRMASVEALDGVKT